MLFLPFFALAQKEVRLISSRGYEARKEWGVNRFYKPVFLHEGSTLSADSSDYNPEERFFDAYGNVVITQPNGTIIYADKLHYMKDSRIAELTNNVRMVDAKGAVLTTNHLTYNLNTKIGKYIGGGRIINAKDTLNSKVGHYFENTQDAYFQNDVLVRAPQTNIYTDSLRYNSVSKMAYFYGPTNIRGKKGENNLYTENGDYNTETDRARFGKNNLYTEGSKFLRGDSLYYDGKAGYGRAIKNVVFIDTAQRGILYGQKGVYRKKDESITMTEKAYTVMIVQNDSTKKDTAAHDGLLPDSLQTDRTLHRRDSLSLDSANQRDTMSKKTDSVFMAADTLFSQVILLKDYKPIVLNLDREGGELDEEEELDSLGEMGMDSLANGELDSLTSDSTQARTRPAPPDSLVKQLEAAATDSLKQVKPDISADSLMKLAQDSVPKKGPPQQLDESTIKKAIAKTSKLQSDTLVMTQRERIGSDLKADSLLISKTMLPLSGQGDSTLNVAKRSAMERPKQDTSLRDTARTRIVKAFHHVRIFKSDLQARADSAYYGYPDSMMRFYGRPMIWAQGSQLSGDTIYMQLKNQKLDNMLLKTHAFIVNTQLDSAKFNQVKGRKITGFFTNNKLDRMFVDGNAESIYYTTEGNKISGMTRSLGSRIKINFENNEVSNIVNIRKTENSYTPVGILKADREILEGFIWKPKDRPASKEDIINPPKITEAQADTLPKDNTEPQSEQRESKTSPANTKDRKLIQKKGQIKPERKTERPL